MKTTSILSFIMAVLIIAACGSSRNNKPALATQPAPAIAVAPAKPSNGVYAPGEEELAAIQGKYPGITLQTLKDGHALYTGVCTYCHGAKSIYNRPESAWPHIMDDMAPKANITDAQKDAVYKYVLAIKAVQPKEVK